MVCPEGKELGVISMPGPSAWRVTSTCLITWVERFAPSTSTVSGTSRDRRRRISTSTAASASSVPITGRLTEPTASCAYWDRGPLWFLAPERIS